MFSGYGRFLVNRWPLVSFGFATVFFGNFGQSFFLAWYGADIQQALNLAASHYGLVYALATLASGLLIMALGGLIDRWPLQRFSLVVASGLILACLVMSQVNGIVSLALGLFLLRLCGQGLMPHTAQTTMARYFGPDRGKAISLSASGVAVGEVILPSTIVALILLVGWQQSWLLLALAILLLYVPLNMLLLRKATLYGQLQLPAEPVSQDNKHFSRRHVLADWRFWCILPALITGPFMLTGIFIQQNFVLTSKDWSSSLLASSFIGYGISHWGSAMLAGVLVDRHSARKLVSLVMLPLLLALLSLALLEGRWLAPLFMLLLGTGIGMAQPVFTALWAEIYGTRHLGAIRSLATAIMIFATAAAPWVFGLFIDGGVTAMALFSGCAWYILFAAIMVQLAFPFNSNK